MDAHSRGDQDDAWALALVGYECLAAECPWVQEGALDQQLRAALADPVQLALLQLFCASYRVRTRLRAALLARSGGCGGSCGAAVEQQLSWLPTANALAGVHACWLSSVTARCGVKAAVLLFISRACAETHAL